MTLFAWIILLGIILILLGLDLGVFNRKAHVIAVKEAIGWSIFWVALGLLFGVLVYCGYCYHWFGLGLNVDGTVMLAGERALVQYLTGYLVEKSLSVDNIFVIALIFSYFRISPLYQHKVLFWGIVGALVFRGIMIAVGAALMQQFAWVTYIFGALLFFTAIKLLISRNESIEPEKGMAYRLVKRFFPTTTEDGGGRFFINVNGRRTATILFVALVIIETADIMFAFDSIPAIFAITSDPFIVFSSNIFAILGLRSLYFLLAGYLDRLRYLKMGLVVLLLFISVKMLIIHFYKIPALISLGVIAFILTVSILLSLRAKPLELPEGFQEFGEDLEELAQLGRRQARRLVILVFGSTLMLIGAILLVLPGPGILTIVLGLSILALEYAWAKRLLAEVKAYWNKVATAARKTFNME